MDYFTEKRLEIVPGHGGVWLFWDVASLAIFDDDIHGFVVKRRTPDTEFKALNARPSRSGKFVDNAITKGSYLYQVELVNCDGDAIHRSVEIPVEYAGGAPDLEWACEPEFDTGDRVLVKVKNPEHLGLILFFDHEYRTMLRQWGAREVPRHEHDVESTDYYAYSEGLQRLPLGDHIMFVATSENSGRYAVTPTIAFKTPLVERIPNTIGRAGAGRIDSTQVRQVEIRGESFAIRSPGDLYSVNVIVTDPEWIGRLIEAFKQSSRDPKMEVPNTVRTKNMIIFRGSEAQSIKTYGVPYCVNWEYGDEVGALIEEVRDLNWKRA
jgi:hypothetical protein